MGGALDRLARRSGVCTRVTGADGRLWRASPDAVLAALAALEIPVQRLADVPAADRSQRLRSWRRRLDPCRVWWEGVPVPIRLRRPAGAAWMGCRVRVRLEAGEVRCWDVTRGRAPIAREVRVEGERFEVRLLHLDTALPHGVHHLEVESDGKRLEGVLLAAPRTAFAAGAREPLWGTFLPLYALHSRRSLGNGDLTDLSELVRWTAARAGAVVGTLPLLAGFSSHADDPSPYLPVSRIFWNEMIADPAAAPGWGEAAEVRALLETADGKAVLRRLRSERLLDWPAAWALRRRLLDGMARRFFESGQDGSPSFRCFLERNPQAVEYARFRATREQRTGADHAGADWHNWPARARSGVLVAADYAEGAVRRHLYAQWLTEGQLARVATEAGKHGVSLYLDLPLGVHPAGYDTWRERGLFAWKAEVGAPPDRFVASGQTWGFPPLHPQRLREDGYRYLRRAIAFQMRHAGMLRLDHVMGVHRQFWVPRGGAPSEGVYVRYPGAELYALLLLESRRNSCELVGEDLGTTPPALRPAMRRRGLRRSWALGLDLAAGRRISSQLVPAGAVAGLDTHDTPTFAATWEGLSAKRRVMSGLPEDRSAALDACLTALGESAARVVLVNLEDLWGETSPQNAPGTSAAEHPNWRQRGRLGLEAFQADSALAQRLSALDRSRRRCGGADPPVGVRG